MVVTRAKAPGTPPLTGGPLTSVKRGLSRSLTDGPPRRSGHFEARTAQIPKLTAQALVRSGFAAVIRVEVWVSSPEPAVGVFTPAGTCPGRFQRYFVIGYSDPGQNRLP